MCNPLRVNAIYEHYINNEVDIASAKFSSFHTEVLGMQGVAV